MYTIIRLMLRAQKRYYKKTTLEDLDIEIATLKMFIRIASEEQYISMKAYEIWSGKVVEIGKMLGGWMKGISAKAV